MFSVHNFRDSGMPPRAVVATRDDAERVGAGLGIDPSDLHIEEHDDQGAMHAMAAMAARATAVPERWR